MITTTPGLKNGAIVSLCGLVVLGSYLFINKKQSPPRQLPPSCPWRSSWREKDKGSEPEESRTTRRNRPHGYLIFGGPCCNEVKKSCPETSPPAEEKAGGMVLRGLVDEKAASYLWTTAAGIKPGDYLPPPPGGSRFLGLKLSRNKGHQNALLAGLMTAKELCDMAISLDADLQDDVDAPSTGLYWNTKMAATLSTGCAPSGRRIPGSKRTTAEGFYKVMTGPGVDIVDNTPTTG